MKTFLRKQTLQACFRQWRNKSYSAFNSLKKCIKIGVLCFSYWTSISPEYCLAQSDSAGLKVIGLREVEISADASPDVFAQTGRAVMQIRKTEIEHAASQSLVDLLDYFPNVDLRQRGPYGTQADISIRGSSFDQTLVLLNGININDPQTGHYTLNLPIDIESIEKIEILEGPAARIFGNNALGGAVNFITGTQANNCLKTSLAGGRHGFFKASLTGNIHTGNFSSHVAASGMKSDGYMPNTDFKHLNIFTQNKWNNGLLPLDLQLGYTQKELGANGFYGPKYPNQYESLHSFFAALKGETDGRVRFSPSVYWRRNYDHYVLIRKQPEVYQNFHYTDVYGADMNVSLASHIGKTSLGFLFRSERIYSNNLGEDMENPKKVPRQDDQWYTKTDHRTNVSIFAEQNLYIGRWSASAGILMNNNSHTARKMNIFPGMDVACMFGRIFKAYVSANRAMRLPTFTDLYYHGAMNLGNPNLKPEYCTEYETGIKSADNWWNTCLNYFYRRTSDAIDWIWLENEQKWHTENLTQLNTQGISASGRFNFRKLVRPDFWVHSLTSSYTFMYADKSAYRHISFYALDYLKHKFTLGLEHTVRGKIGAHWQICRQDRNGTYLAYDAETGTETETPYKAFWKIDLRIYRQSERWYVFAEVSNLSGRQYQDTGNITLPGRWIRAGLSLTLSQP
jgi:iron complex outermembrane receptor protein